MEKSFPTEQLSFEYVTGHPEDLAVKGKEIQENSPKPLHIHRSKSTATLVKSASSTTVLEDTDSKKKPAKQDSKKKLLQQTSSAQLFGTLVRKEVVLDEAEGIYKPAKSGKVGDYPTILVKTAVTSDDHHKKKAEVPPKLAKHTSVVVETGEFSDESSEDNSSL
eukprot:TRINITY_DN38186_c0_g1_i1.p1 TRINITY_DN38186_c0_g1~~TRINITY_DN38186_c0_g1_i1.p1  ORF type:complete len:188 (+),score=14.41 TRINITY_DN38186_c0_g1_i1:74-565(+)